LKKNFNIASPKQLGEIIYNDLNTVPSYHKIKIIDIKSTLFLIILDLHKKS